jgi:Tol biopolymer transport system component
MPSMTSIPPSLRLLAAFATCCCFAPVVSTGNSSNSLGTSHPYVSAAPVTEPRLFGDGVFSTPYDEFGLTFSLDGRTAFFSRSVPRSNAYFILTSTFRGGTWTTPEIARFSGRYWDFDPVVSPDGSRMFFSSDRPVPGDADRDKDFDIWTIERTSSGWSDPRRLDETVNSREDETFASAASNGTLYFVSGRDGGREHFAIFRSRLVNGKYQSAERLKGPVNDPENWSLEVLVAPDESFLLLAPYNRKDGYGSFDIYISEQKNGEWTAPRNLGPKINTAARDYSPRFSPDGKYLFWASERGFDQPRNYAELVANEQRTLNGWGNIYQIELSEVGLHLRGKP